MIQVQYDKQTMKEYLIAITCKTEIITGNLGTERMVSSTIFFRVCVHVCVNNFRCCSHLM